MSGHTPGPWTIIPAVPHEELDGAYAVLAGIEGADGNPVCVFGDTAGSGTMYENEADYHLIAAAPDLLDELKRLSRAYVGLLEAGRDRIVMLGGDCDAVERMEEGDPALRSARAVIAKAAGGK